MQLQYKRRLTAPTPNNVVVTINATIILVISMELIRVFIYIKEVYVDILLFIVFVLLNDVEELISGYLYNIKEMCADIVLLFVFVLQYDVGDEPLCMYL